MYLSDFKIMGTSQQMKLKFATETVYRYDDGPECPNYWGNGSGNSSSSSSVSNRNQFNELSDVD